MRQRRLLLSGIVAATAMCWLFAPPAALARSLDSIKARNALSVCAHPNALPFSSKNGERHGIEVVMNDLFDKLRDLIEHAKVRGEIASKVDSALLAHNLFALYFVFLVLWLGSGAPAPEERRPTLRQMLELQLGVTPGSQIARRRNRKKQS